MGRKFVDGEKRNIQTLPVPSLLSADDDKDESDNNKKDQGLQGKGQQWQNVVAPGQRYVPTVAAASSRGAYLVLGSQRGGGGGGLVTDLGLKSLILSIF